MNKLIAVTGGTKGIGRAIIERFALAGFDIVTCARNRADLEALATSLSTLYPGIQITTQVADMAKKNEVDIFCEVVKKLNRPVDVLVNNAGYFVPGALLTEPDGTLEGMIHANLYSAYYTSRKVVPLMLPHQSGYIFNICSIASFMAYTNGGSYAISKFAMLGLSKGLREELKDKNIRVTAVMPGATRTASWDGVALPDERFIAAEDLAETIFSAYSLSPRSVIEEIVIRPQLGDI